LGRVWFLFGLILDLEEEAGRGSWKRKPDEEAGGGSWEGKPEE
jgi:hypothetical protein